MVLINRLMKQVMDGGPEAAHAGAQARELLGLDELNWSYFLCLYRASARGIKAQPVRIFEEGQGKGASDERVVYPLSIAPQKLLNHLRRVEYAELKSSSELYGQAAEGVALWVKKMQAGSGSSMTRSTYLARRQGIAVDQVKLGAKGTDLFVEVSDPRDASRRNSISLAEAQIVQCIRDLERGEVGELFFHDIVSSETEESLRELWKKPSLGMPRPSSKMSRFGESRQALLPTLDGSGQISFNRKAPGGHALFAVDALRAAFKEELRPKTDRTLIAAISNGEDLSSAPDRFMLGYMAKHRIPIVLVTTDRTAVDIKGGIISLLEDREGGVSLTVVETAQAKEAGQARLFASLQGAVSTNLTLFNYEVLAPLITQEVQEIGEERFMEIISPDLIINAKDQVDRDGVMRKYRQLEGAMGSTIMNLDRYWRKKHGQPLVHLINVDLRHRTQFFSPIKSAFDYFMQFHSDRFVLDASAMRLRDLRPGNLPMIQLTDPATQDKYYQDVQNVLEAFDGASIRDLDELEVEGQVVLRGVVLRGRVRILNRTGRAVDLRRHMPSSSGRIVLENTALEIGEGAKVLRKSA